ncbi:histone acetylation protein-domain-containing protein [Xylaria arbuscula]|nr:histone acetylation protein-domain-containing protein [Xylaria arbuscula]
MTNTTPPNEQNQQKDNPLIKALAQALPKGSSYTAWHLSTTPAITDALCYPPALNSTTEKRPSKPLKTYCEKHFLAVSITDPARASDVLVLALEIYVYTTNFSTSIFVAKADSTGYLYLQSTPQGFSSIRAVTVAFLDFLVQHRKRPSKQLVINLFARAQSQYLFPGSVKNDRKHILDDRGLIKWWCRVLNPVLEEYVQTGAASEWNRVHGYLVIPGLDDYETRAFVPRSEHAARNWSLGHPLELLSPYTKDATTYGSVPPRCLIPTYPDDPKARFVEELEESTSEKAKLLGGWKTPKTLDQFWEMMAFRQECSSGRMTGFVWLVFEPPKASTLPSNPDPTTMNSDPIVTTLPTPAASFSGTPHHADPLSTPEELGRDNVSSLETPISSPSNLVSSSTKLLRRKRRVRKILKGPIVPRQPRVKTHRAKYPDKTETPYYYWPEAGRGQVVLDDNGYQRAVELLLHLEFKGLEQAIASTSRWTGEVNMGEDWALSVVGEKVVLTQPASEATLKTVNNLTGSIQRKRKSED